MSTQERAFDSAGLASLDDLETPRWQALFSRLEKAQRDFLATSPFTRDYRWPRDPLHTCIRLWEYPFVYHKLETQGWGSKPNARRVLADLGSGATFFPFAVASLGHEVIAIDADPEAQRSLAGPTAALDVGSGAVRFLLNDITRLDLEDESLDGAYCISVLEHVENPETVIAEVTRVLKPGGVFILTFDVALNEQTEIGPAQFHRLREALTGAFEPLDAERFVHPMRVLTSDNSPYPYYPPEGMVHRVWHAARRCLSSLAGREGRERRVLATTYGVALRRLEHA